MTSKDKLRTQIERLRAENTNLIRGEKFWHSSWRNADLDYQDAHEHARLWKEVARTLLRQRNDWRTDARREEYRADLLGRAHRECHMQRDGAIARAEKAEKELNDARESLREANETAKPLRAMTARELLDAAWDAAHVPEGGVIPAGAEYLWRSKASGTIGQGTAHGELSADMEVAERRLLDAPTEPEPEKPVVTDEMIERAMDRFCELDSDHERSIWDCIEGALTAALAEEEEA